MPLTKIVRESNPIVTSRSKADRIENFVRRKVCKSSFFKIYIDVSGVFSSDVIRSFIEYSFSYTLAHLNVARVFIWMLLFYCLSPWMFRAVDRMPRKFRTHSFFFSILGNEWISACTLCIIVGVPSRVLQTRHSRRCRMTLSAASSLPLTCESFYNR